jgi:2-polyprenyl-6-methoxyphenol hydroxylase-like FAD-dependent oxidoreductase
MPNQYIATSNNEMTTSLKVLVCGSGCGGPALVYWLTRLGHRVTVIERFPILRATGAQIDLRAQGIEVVKRMGLLERVRDKLVDEEGTRFVDSAGNSCGTILANKSGKGAQTLTSEYEIMRGDLVQILYDATKDHENVVYIFGKSVERFEQDERKVTVYFSDGSADDYDMLVGADGQGSRIRKAILPYGAPEPYRHIGACAAYWKIPRQETDDRMASIYAAPEGRAICRRCNSASTQVLVAKRDDSNELASLAHAPVQQQKEMWERILRGAGWETKRFVEGMKAADDFYCQELVQVKTDTWYKGRVVLLGDAGYCPSPLTGMGTTASFVGAYVLAGEIARHPGDLGGALAGYEAILRPFVNEIQTLYLGLLHLAMPTSPWVIRMRCYMTWILCSLKIPDFIAKFSSENRGGWELPEYPELRAIEKQ